MSSQEERQKLNYEVQCDSCTESWSDGLLELIDNLTKEELVQVSDYINKKLNHQLS